MGLVNKNGKGHQTDSMDVEKSQRKDRVARKKCEITEGIKMMDRPDKANSLSRVSMSKCLINGPWTPQP